MALQHQTNHMLSLMEISHGFPSYIVKASLCNVAYKFGLLYIGLHMESIVKLIIAF